MRQISKAGALPFLRLVPGSEASTSAQEVSSLDLFEALDACTDAAEHQARRIHETSVTPCHSSQTWGPWQQHGAAQRCFNGHAYQCQEPAVAASHKPASSSRSTGAKQTFTHAQGRLAALCPIYSKASGRACLFRTWLGMFRSCSSDPLSAADLDHRPTTFAYDGLQRLQSCNKAV